MHVLFMNGRVPRWPALGDVPALGTTTRLDAIEQHGERATRGTSRPVLAPWN